MYFSLNTPGIRILAHYFVRPAGLEPTTNRVYNDIICSLGRNIYKRLFAVGVPGLEPGTAEV